jgi:membrane associated rhomboid family serine protease
MSRYQRTTYSSTGYPRWTRAVKIIIIACAVTFFVQIIIGRAFTEKFGLTPADITQHGYIWQLATYIFLHDTGTILHILFNMLGLWMFGSELEQLWGTRRFTRFFFVCGIGAGVLMVLLYLLSSGGQRVTTIGASGAVYGVLLAFGILFPDRIIYWIIFPIPARYFVMILGGIAFYMSLSASSSNIAHVAHLGGMLCGYIYMKSTGLILKRHRSGSRVAMSFKQWYGQWQRKRLRKKFEVYYNRRHPDAPKSDDDEEKWRRWKN